MSRTGAPPLTYTNRMGAHYVLHAGTTKTGRVRYFVARTAGEGALTAMPDGFEFCESLNGVVSMRRVDTAAPVVPPEDVEVVRAELARHEHLHFHRVEAVKGEIVVFEPHPGIDSVGLDDVFGLRLSAAVSEERLRTRMARSHYAPVMKFVPAAASPGPARGPRPVPRKGESVRSYDVHRMTYRGRGGWSWPLGTGLLQAMAKRFVRHVGTEGFFDLL